MSRVSYSITHEGCLSYKSYKSLAKSNKIYIYICYPEAFSFTNKQVDWGCKHEKAARELYHKQAILLHTGFEIADSGLVIDPQWPYIGASPDGIINCKCCERGVLKLNAHTVTVENEDSKFCLQEQNGLLQLDHAYAYYYQVQTQMFHYVCM